MYAVNQMLVCLDLSEMDEILVKYARFFCETAGVKKVYFVHNVKTYDLGDDFREWFGDIDLAGEVEKEIGALVRKHFGDVAEYDILVSEEPNTEVILADVVRQYKIQLTMVGRKEQLKGSGILGTKLLRILPCSVLVVPELAPHKITKILVALDFSKSSQKALEHGRHLTEQLGVAADVLHTYQLPSQYFPMVNEKEAVKKAEKHVWEKISELKKKNPALEAMNFSIVRAAGKSVAERLENHLARNGNDLLILGRRGSNPLPTLKLGSVPTELYGSAIRVPLFLVYS
jgi:nucleotide-binding universal stress UspA family protein